MPGMQFLKDHIDPEVLHMFGERAIIMHTGCGPSEGGIAFPLKGPGQMVAIAMA